MAYKAAHTYDALPSSPNHQDYRPMAVNIASLPPEKQLPDIPRLDQGLEGACGGHGGAGARETLELIVNGTLPLVPLSRAFIYYRGRLLEGTQNQDAGMEIRDVCKVLATDGVCTEDQFPYKVGAFRDVPSDFDIAAAAQYRIATYVRLSGADEARAALANDLPVIVGMAVHESFERSIGPDGRVPIPDTNDPLLGYHCTFLNGYKPDPQNIGMFLLHDVNSWGLSFGENGTCWLPEGYANNPNLVTDLWSISLS